MNTTSIPVSIQTKWTTNSVHSRLDKDSDGSRRSILVLGQTAADGTGLLRAEVEGEQVLLLVRLPQRRLLLLQDHCEHARDRGAHQLAEEGTDTIRIDSVEFRSRE
jgi:hypothetical protein